MVDWCIFDNALWTLPHPVLPVILMMTFALLFRELTAREMGLVTPNVRRDHSFDSHCFGHDRLPLKGVYLSGFEPSWLWRRIVVWVAADVSTICIALIFKGCIGSWWRNRRQRDHWGDLGVDGWIILGWISRRWDVSIWTELGWPRIETVGGRLWVR